MVNEFGSSEGGCSSTREHQHLDKEKSFVENIIVGTQYFQSLLYASLEEQFKDRSCDTISDQQLMDVVLEQLWDFWNKTLEQIEKENCQVLDSIQLCKSDTLLSKFTDALAKFRVMGKVYTLQIVEAIKGSNLKKCMESCQLTITIALEDMANRMALKHLLCQCASDDAVAMCSDQRCHVQEVTKDQDQSLVETIVDLRKTSNDATSQSFSPEKRSEDILAGIYWRLIYEKSPKMYESRMKNALKDKHRLETIFRGKKCLEQMPAAVAKSLLDNARALVHNADAIKDQQSFKESFSREYNVSFQ